MSQFSDEPTEKESEGSVREAETTDTARTVPNTNAEIGQSSTVPNQRDTQASELSADDSNSVMDNKPAGVDTVAIHKKSDAVLENANILSKTSNVHEVSKTETVNNENNQTKGRDQGSPSSQKKMTEEAKVYAKNDKNEGVIKDRHSLDTKRKSRFSDDGEKPDFRRKDRASRGHGESEKQGDVNRDLSKRKSRFDSEQQETEEGRQSHRKKSRFSDRIDDEKEPRRKSRFSSEEEKICNTKQTKDKNQSPHRSPGSKDNVKDNRERQEDSAKKRIEGETIELTNQFAKEESKEIIHYDKTDQNQNRSRSIEKQKSSTSTEKQKSSTTTEKSKSSTTAEKQKLSVTTEEGEAFPLRKEYIRQTREEQVPSDLVLDKPDKSLVEKQGLRDGKGMVYTPPRSVYMATKKDTAKTETVDQELQKPRLKKKGTSGLSFIAEAFGDVEKKILEELKEPENFFTQKSKSEIIKDVGHVTISDNKEAVAMESIPRVDNKNEDQKKGVVKDIVTGSGNISGRKIRLKRSKWDVTEKGAEQYSPTQVESNIMMHVASAAPSSEDVKLMDEKDKNKTQGDAERIEENFHGKREKDWGKKKGIEECTSEIKGDNEKLEHIGEREGYGEQMSVPKLEDKDKSKVKVESDKKSNGNQRKSASNVEGTEISVKKGLDPVMTTNEITSGHSVTPEEGTMKAGDEAKNKTEGKMAEATESSSSSSSDSDDESESSSGDESSDTSESEADEMEPERENKEDNEKMEVVEEVREMALDTKNESQPLRTTGKNEVITIVGNLCCPWDINGWQRRVWREEGGCGVLVHKTENWKPNRSKYIDLIATRLHIFLVLTNV